MIRNIVILASLLAIIGGYTWYDSDSRQRTAPQADEVRGATINQTAPDFTFIDMDGKKRSLSDFRGKAVVLNFWASWCAPCVIEFPQMLNLAKQTQDDSIFIFLSQDESMEDVQRFLKQHARKRTKNVFVGLDDNKTIAQTLYQTFKLPETYLITHDGRIAQKIIGADIAWDSEPMRKTINSLGK